MSRILNRIRDRVARAFRPVWIVRDFLRAHPNFVPSIILGLCAGIALSHVPFVGKLAGDVVLIFAITYGLTKRG